jgi:hypothetical protein
LSCLAVNSIYYFIRNKILLEKVKLLLKTFEKIIDVLSDQQKKPLDEVQAYLTLSKILTVLYDEKIIDFRNMFHYQIRADFLLMRNEGEGRVRDIIEALALKHNRSPKTIQGIIYPLEKL